MSFRQRFLLSILMFLVSFWFTTPAVFAAGMMVEPAFQFVTISATASSTTREITLTNQTDTQHEYALSTVDIRQSDTTGQVAFIDKPQADTSYALASFLRVPEEKITLQPAESKKILIDIVDNQNLSPGGHYGAVLVQVSSVGAQGEEVVVPMVSSVLLVHKVGGERFHINLKPMSVPAFWQTIPKSMLLQFENQGNVHVIPHGQVVITDLFGRRIAEGTINEGSVVVMPENLRAISVNLSMRGLALPLLPLKLQISGTAKPGDLVFAQSSVVAYLPIWVVVVILVLLVLGIVVVRYVKTKR